MSDKLIIKLSVVICVIFILIAFLYERPQLNKNSRAAYLPEKGFVGRAEKGHKLFNEHCIKCHGSKLEGTTNGPPLIHSYYKPDHHGDLAIYLAVHQGVIQHHWKFGNMPAMKHLSAEDAGHLLKYIRQQQRQQGLF